MMYVLQLVLNAIFFMVMAYLFPNVIHVSSFGAALLAAIIISILNIFLRPILVILTLPLTFLTLGLFLLVINAVMLQFADFIMGNAFNIDGFTIIFFMAIALSLWNILIQNLILDPYYEKKMR
ncbi:phage holin family protein [Massilibacterium senegalense]|uniref:phage holin family protein n=1 Tax=Massilibacterium senegalense TaxID=1632858 RepID=UPI0007813D93|nr:phage holin family protein [Massilibacterium senegalense]